MSKKRKSLWAWLMAFAMATLLMTSSAMDVQATEDVTVDVASDAKMTAEEMLRSLFSLEYYAEHNPDVVAVYGYNYDALYQHYIGCGIHEGRDVSPIVNLRAYRDCNPDILATYGDDFMGVYLHFAETGIAEVAEGLRQPLGVRLDFALYANESSEVDFLADGNFLKIAELFISNGMPEGEWVVTESDDSEEVDEDVPVANVSKTVEYSSDNDSSSSSSSDSDEGASEPEKPAQPSTPVEPPCSHPSVICGEKCSVCGATVNHDFGASGTDPYCNRCNASYVQVAGCNHPSWNGGACTVCKKVDLYYQEHGTYHVDEKCPECGYQGTLLYDEDKCPGHDYGGDGVCSKCGGKEEASVTPPGGGEDGSGEDTEDDNDSDDGTGDDLETDADDVDADVTTDVSDVPSDTDVNVMSIVADEIDVVDAA